MTGNILSRILFFWPSALLIRLGQLLLACNQTAIGRHTTRPAFRLFCRFVLHAQPYLLRRPRSNDVLSAPQISEFIDRQRFIASIPCVCRAGRTPCSHPLHAEHPLDVCLSFGLAAIVQIGTGLGKRLSPDEAKALCQDARASGLSQHAVYSLGLLQEICNCCRETCSVVKAYEAGVPEAVRPSPFLAVRGEDCDGCKERDSKVCETLCPYHQRPSSPACLGCGLCSAHCPRGAITMTERPRRENQANESQDMDTAS